jgi:hypothetical protein
MLVVDIMLCDPFVIRSGVAMISDVAASALRFPFTRPLSPCRENASLTRLHWQ